VRNDDLNAHSNAWDLPGNYSVEQALALATGSVRQIVVLTPQVTTASSLL